MKFNSAIVAEQSRPDLPCQSDQLSHSPVWSSDLLFCLVSFWICPGAVKLSDQLCVSLAVFSKMCTFFMCYQVPHWTLHSHIPTKKRCPEVGCPFPTGSPFQWLEIPLCTKRPDMIPQHCRQGREQGTVLIRWALLSGKILKGMQPIVVNCMGPHSIPNAAGMCYLDWIGETSIPAAGQCLCWIVDYSLFHSVRIVSIIWSSHGPSSRCSASDDWTFCVHSHTAHFNFTCRLLCIHTPKCAFEVNILIPLHSHCIVPCAVMTVYSVLISVMAFLFIDS